MKPRSIESVSSTPAETEGPTDVAVPSHDYVLDPPPGLRLASAGQATLDELMPVFVDVGGIPMVGVRDPEMGPYTRCIMVETGEVGAFAHCAYRLLTSDELNRVVDAM